MKPLSKKDIRADLKEYSTPLTRLVNDWIIKNPDYMEYAIELAKEADSEETLEAELMGYFYDAVQDDLDLTPEQMLNELRWNELAHAWYNSIRGGEEAQRKFLNKEPLVEIDIEKLPTLDKKKKIDQLLEQLSQETDSQKKEQIKRHIERIKRAKLIHADKWPGQEKAVYFGKAPSGWFAYEPYKKGASESDTKKVILWDYVKEHFFEKGNRWSSVVKELKKLYPDTTQEDIEELLSHVRYYLEQYKIQISSKKEGLSLADAITHFSKHESKYGFIVRIDLKDKIVEWSDGHETNFDETVEMVLEQKKEGSEFGFFDGPKDLGKNPSGDFPSVKWLPKGHEDDQGVSTNVVSGNLKKDARMEIPYWIDPSGKSFELLHDTHDTWIQKNMEQLSKDYGIDFSKMNKSRDSYLSFMLSNNWARSWVDYSAISFTVNGLNRLPHLNDFVAEHWVPEKTDYILIEDVATKKLYQVLDPFPNLETAERTEFSKRNFFSSKNPFSAEKQNEVAAQYGPEMNIALSLYFDAIKSGHPKDRAFEYALNEIDNMKLEVKPKAFVSAINTYII